MPLKELWLSIDLSGARGTVALHEQGAALRELGSVELEDGRHSEGVLGALTTLLAQTGHSLAEVDRWLTGSGPGSFTGLRVAHSVVKAFHFVSGKPVELLDLHEARALAYLAQSEKRPTTLGIGTQLTRDQILVSQFRVLEKGVEWVSEETVPTLPEGVLLSEFPMRASYLAQALELARRRQTLTDRAAVAQASPLYFGSRFG
ncbi:tRNA (adenosine(37)-N6)-threonylcarbamoyltransferase complex dimerization subunit type 1 TsaB [bacterium]|nr:tRNA (adenosine(37)-N6)-threonylcarbamoyltransferase complex dimerization subunit type 1 TsaB [bacterium]